MKRKKIIAREFRNHAKDIHDYIAENSPKNAEKFQQKILHEMAKIESDPTANPPVTNFPNKTKRNRYRTFMKSFKIVYKVLKEVLVFAGILHKSQDNKAYNELRKRKYEV